MNQRILLVVGDKFSFYVQGKDAITLSQLHGLLSLPVQFLPGQSTTLLVPGQGLGDTAVRELLDAASRSANLAHFDFSLWHHLPERATSALSHKRRPENILLSMPRQLSEDEYEMHLMIDEHSELMQDHQSGQHIQGMVLIEAARQMTILISECFLIPKSDVNYGFVLNSMSADYNNFTFPIAASIVCRIVEKQLDNPRRLNFVMEAEVRQCGMTVTAFRFSISAMEHERLGKRERMLANKMQDNYLASITQSLPENRKQKVENL
ncbi:AfsA-related hotdog domain-containing protein [Marinimicrobium alkaliphilum]|uniref:AfsA-related hotdog domain-containing protein n=1 Tax=Marinimicrobium alkaliphilum TaxID=2202654 RepID=UPI001300AF84|nr:AfsA-related hotdog domain-containing protein [Marinimicrobium alkaliphilum]